MTGHPGTGGLARTGYINGLYPTKRRIALCNDIDVPGRIYGEAGNTYDKRDGSKVSARVAELFHHRWIEPVPLDGYRDEWSKRRVYYRLTEFGRAAIERGRR